MIKGITGTMITDLFPHDKYYWVYDENTQDAVRVLIEQKLGDAPKAIILCYKLRSFGNEGGSVISRLFKLLAFILSQRSVVEEYDGKEVNQKLGFWMTQRIMYEIQILGRAQTRKTLEEQENDTPSEEEL